MKKRWNLSPVNKELVETLVSELDILPVTAQLLINRGLVDCDKAFSFLSPDMGKLHDPFLMKDMDLATSRIIRAIDLGEQIAVYGDFDVDGATASALLYLFFEKVGVKIISYIPDRKSEGYGLNKKALQRLRGQGVGLVITVDCGTSNSEEIEFARTIGLDVIVTDHHEVPLDGGPKASAFLNPMRPDCAFPFKGLAGVGVAFNLVIAMRTRLRENGWFKSGRTQPNLKRLLDIVSIGTVADMVPLTDENRIFVSHGLSVLSGTRSPGLLALMDVCGVPPSQVSAEKIAFQLAPRINAAGRLKSADMAFRLLTTQDPHVAAKLARELDAVNTDRRAMESRIVTRATSMVQESLIDNSVENAIVLSSNDWHPGVIGIVASRMVERFFRPSALIAMDGDTGRGSVRGIHGSDVMGGLKEAASLLERFGGHRAAAGFSIKRENLEEFKKVFIDFFNNSLTDEDLVPVVRVDCEVSLSALSQRLISELDRLQPFGRSNAKPLLYTKGADVVSSRVVGEKHLKMVLRQDGRTQEAIAFNMGEMHPLSGPGFDVAFHPYMDRFRGAATLNLNVKDVKAQAPASHSTVPVA